MAATNSIYIAQLQAEYLLPDDVSLGSGQSTSYINSLKKINRLPISKCEVYYSDDYWDFSELSSLNIVKNNMRFNFRPMANSPFKDDLKNHVLLSLLENKTKIQSIHKRFLIIRKFLSYIEQVCHIYHMQDISTKHIGSYIQMIRDDGSVTKLRNIKSSLRAFFVQYSANFADIMSDGMENLFEQDDPRAFKSYQMEHRTLDIPHDYFNDLISVCIQYMNDMTAPEVYRGVACVYIILSQTGLRIGEILGLKTDALKTGTIFNGEEVNYLHYNTWKRENGNNTVSRAFTYINELSRKAYDTMLHIFQPQREKFDVDYLYVGGKRLKASSLPINSESFKRSSFQFFCELDKKGLLKAVNIADNVYPTLHRYKVSSIRYLSSSYPYGAVKTLAFPDSQQFRFHCCSVLAEKGVPLEYIQRFMSHLTNDMVRYHILPQNSPQEDMEYSLKVLKEVVSGKTTILGDSKGIMDKINEFIEANHFRVEKDLDAICEGLAKNIPIRQKTGGVCIKSSQLRDCSIDAKTNEFYCAYSVCPNIVHFYYMADISYRQCCELQESIGINLKRGHKKQVQKERHMLYSIASKRLSPELEDLRKVVKRDGVESVIMMHPELADIISNINEIEKETTEWISTNG